MRRPFTALAATAAPLRWNDVNTDDIAPAFASSPLAGRTDRRGQTDQERYHENAFAAYRWTDSGSLRSDFVLNQPRYEGAQILVAGSNFGCGSSRETAVWCLDAIGVRCIIAPSFGDIFYGNCFQNGLLAITLALADVEELMRQAESAPVPTFTVDLRTSLISAPDAQQFTFEVGDYHREALLNGIDEIDLTMSRLDAVKAYETRYYRVRPWLAPIASGS